MVELAACSLCRACSKPWDISIFKKPVPTGNNVPVSVCFLWLVQWNTFKKKMHLLGLKHPFYTAEQAQCLLFPASAHWSQCSFWEPGTLVPMTKNPALLTAVRLYLLYTPWRHPMFGWGHQNFQKRLNWLRNSLHFLTLRVNLALHPTAFLAHPTLL